MPSGPINVPVPGLLGLLQLKTMGQNPSQLGDVVQPVLNIERYYLNGQAQVFPFNTAPPITTGANIGLAYGAAGFEQALYVHEYSVLMPLGAGDQVDQFCLTRVTNPGTLNIHSVIETINFTPVIVGPNNQMALTARDFWCNKGEALGYQCYMSLAGSSAQPFFTLRGTTLFA